MSESWCVNDISQWHWWTATLRFVECFMVVTTRSALEAVHGVVEWAPEVNSVLFDRSSRAAATEQRRRRGLSGCVWPVGGQWLACYIVRLGAIWT
jgi:hypothetical protein